MPRNTYPAWEQLPKADTDDPLPGYMTVDMVEVSCRSHVPLALEHDPPPGADGLRLSLILGHRHVVCADCGATAVYGLTRLRWSDILNLSVKARCIEFNRRVAEARLSEERPGAESPSAPTATDERS